MSQRKTTRTVGTALVVLAGVAGSTVLGTTATASADSQHDSRRIKNVIYLLGDGMGRTHVTAARERYYGAAGKLNMEKLRASGQVSTYAVRSAPASPARPTSRPTWSPTPPPRPPPGPRA